MVSWKIVCVLLGEGRGGGEVAPRLLALNGEVKERVLPKNGARVEVGGEELAASLKRALRGHAAHVGNVGHVAEIVHNVVNLRVNRHLVLPLELGPHAAELHVGAAGRLDIIHDVHVDVVQDHHRLVRARGRVVHDVAEDHA